MHQFQSCIVGLVLWWNDYDDPSQADSFVLIYPEISVSGISAAIPAHEIKLVGNYILEIHKQLISPENNVSATLDSVNSFNWRHGRSKRW